MPEVETTVSVDVEVWCAKCGAGLCSQTTVGSRHGEQCFYVEPCQKCLDDEYERKEEAA